MITPPATDIDNVAEARLPAAFEAAKQALALCTSIELCLDWIRRSEAIEHAAGVAGDEVLYKLALRVSARAMRRVGELLKMSGWSDPKLTTAPQNEVVRRSGMSTYQQLVAVRLAELPEATFAHWIEPNDRLPSTASGFPFGPISQGSDSNHDRSTDLKRGPIERHRRIRAA